MPHVWTLNRWLLVLVSNFQCSIFFGPFEQIGSCSRNEFISNVLEVIFIMRRWNDSTSSITWFDFSTANILTLSRLRKTQSQLCIFMEPFRKTKYLHSSGFTSVTWGISITIRPIWRENYRIAVRYFKQRLVCDFYPKIRYLLVSFVECGKKKSSFGTLDTSWKRRSLHFYLNSLEK